MKNIFEKCRKFKRADEVMAAGVYPYFRTVESAQDTEVIISGKRILMLGSNSYMGLTNHPKVIEAIVAATKKYGSGCAGSRFLNGTLDIHIELEERLAEFVHKEAALCYGTGFQTNLGTIATLAGKDDTIYLDKSDHASIIDGARLAFAQLKKFRHNDLDDLERLLSNTNGNHGVAGGKFVIVDGVFSMEGDIIDLPKLAAVAEKYGAGIMVDDAHAIGVLGPQGEGTAAHFDLTEHVEIIMGTFSKSLAAIGGFIAASKEIINYVKHHSRVLIFSASPSPAAVAAVLAAIRIIKSEPERMRKLWHNTERMQKGLKWLGFDTLRSCTPIIPVLVGDDMTSFSMCRKLHEEGIFVNPIISPAVAPGGALLRVSLMATHSDKQIDFALDKFEKTGKEFGIIV